MKIHKVFNHRKFNCENHSTTNPRISGYLGSRAGTTQGTLDLFHRLSKDTRTHTPVLPLGPTQGKKMQQVAQNHSARLRGRRETGLGLGMH